ncbi:MAG TPA: Kdo hydroxylase family protein [Pirellulales bacterium]|nr:Kdo hydroxylase family protein [Pirellulales bacterium]
MLPASRVEEPVAASLETAHLVDMPRLLRGCAAAAAPLDRELCSLLEQGKILYFPSSPFPLPDADVDVLLRQRQSHRRWHKNIAYRPLHDRLTGFDPKHVDAERLHQVMRTFSRQTIDCVAGLVPTYAREWRLDYASFRPLEEKGRQLRLHARNDLIHVDSFPKRPTYGDRILRIFMNVNPHAERYWITGEPFDVLARDMGVEFVRQFVRVRRPTLWRRVASGMKLPVRPFSPYDQAMRDIHQLMKENESFQRTCHKFHSHFPPGSAWLVFTDSVPHAVVSGQYALEQTVIVPRSTMVSPEKAPAAVLERLEEIRLAKAA